MEIWSGKYMKNEIGITNSSGITDGNGTTNGNGITDGNGVNKTGIKKNEWRFFSLFSLMLKI